MSDPTRKKFPSKIKRPDKPLEYSHKQWQERVSKMKKQKIVKPTGSLRANRESVGSSLGLTRKDLTRQALQESRKK